MFSVTLTGTFQSLRGDIIQVSQPGGLTPSVWYRLEVKGLQRLTDRESSQGNGPALVPDWIQLQVHVGGQAAASSSFPLSVSAPAGSDHPNE